MTVSNQVKVFHSKDKEANIKGVYVPSKKPGPLKYITTSDSLIQGCHVQKKLKRPNLAKSSFNKAKSSKMK